MKNAWILGKEGDIRIEDNSVSRRHAKLTREGDELYIEDIGSTNGTYVNGAPVKRKKVGLRDKIVLGSYNLDLLKLDLPIPDAEFIAAFRKLKHVYETHIKKRVAFQTKSAGRMGLQRSLPMAVPGVLMFILPILFGGGEGGLKMVFQGIGALLSVAAIVTGALLGSREMAKMPQRMSELNEKFKMEYVCPECKRWFGETPWENLRLQGQCPSCRRKF